MLIFTAALCIIKYKCDRKRETTISSGATFANKHYSEKVNLIEPEDKSENAVIEKPFAYENGDPKDVQE